MARRKKRSEPKPAAPDLMQSALERYRPLLPSADFADLLEELKRPLYPALRVNPLKQDANNNIQAWAARYGWTVQPVPFCPTGYWIPSSPEPISQTIEHRLGFYYIQDAASMLPVELFDFNDLSSPLVLDIAASPGGKTTHLLSRTGDRGLVLANDSSADRITALRIVLQNYGAIHAAVTHFPGEKFGAWFPETFDRVLLDAPCSMQGLKTTESHPMRPITAKEQTSLAQRQARLLDSAFQVLKVGGQVVYSTCTLAPEEDEGVLEALLYQYPDAFQIEELGSRLPSPAPALAADGEHHFDPRVQNAARLWPHRFGTAGFFAALITKTAPVESSQEAPPNRPLEQVGQFPVGRKRIQTLSATLLDLYGFDLSHLLESGELDLYERGSSFYAVPLAFLRQFRGLPVQLLGLPLGEEIRGQFMLSHEWVARFGLSFTSGRYLLPLELVPAWLRGEDIHNPPDHNFTKGQVVVVVDEIGRNLGRGRIQHERLKNLLPGRVV